MLAKFLHGNHRIYIFRYPISKEKVDKTKTIPPLLRARIVMKFYSGSKTDMRISMREKYCPFTLLGVL